VFRHVAPRIRAVVVLGLLAAIALVEAAGQRWGA
jgi:hypothetical protein